MSRSKDILIQFRDCPYCETTEELLPEELCSECQEDFGHTYIHEL